MAVIGHNSISRSQRTGPDNWFPGIRILQPVRCHNAGRVLHPTRTGICTRVSFSNCLLILRLFVLWLSHIRIAIKNPAAFHLTGIAKIGWKRSGFHQKQTAIPAFITDLPDLALVHQYQSGPAGLEGLAGSSCSRCILAIHSVHWSRIIGLHLS